MTKGNEIQYNTPREMTKELRNVIINNIKVVPKYRKYTSGKKEIESINFELDLTDEFLLDFILEQIKCMPNANNHARKE